MMAIRSYTQTDTLLLSLLSVIKVILVRNPDRVLLAISAGTATLAPILVRNPALVLHEAAVMKEREAEGTAGAEVLLLMMAREEVIKDTNLVMILTDQVVILEVMEEAR